MVEVDSKGRLRWARTKDLVDTSAGHWKDAGQGRGIVPIDFSDKSEKPPATSSGTSPANEESPEHYLDRQISGNAVTKAIKSNLTRKGVILKLLRKTVQRETWIYVSVSLVQKGCEGNAGADFERRTRIVSWISLCEEDL